MPNVILSSADSAVIDYVLITREIYIWNAICRSEENAVPNIPCWKDLQGIAFPLRSDQILMDQILFSLCQFYKSLLSNPSVLPLVIRDKTYSITFTTKRHIFVTGMKIFRTNSKQFYAIKGKNTTHISVYVIPWMDRYIDAWSEILLRLQFTALARSPLPQSYDSKLMATRYS